MPGDHLATMQRYFRALESGAASALAAILHPDIEQVEHPNALNPRGQRRGYAGMLKSVEQGAQLMRAQHYEIVRSVQEGDAHALEVLWEATLAVRVSESLPEGHTMRARFGVFVEFRDGLVYRQANYDCFEPWS